ncbi:hypothetical protein Acr_18g0007760 [Actinidia rufa]|uniref:Uncharacterized protein n=1 Tax=Actinidia rufa TaxID=165716 RepID=A0A7J0G741_9ERIC|nr:hypothetical protein Acr_18g0007760 [Actinidia rufa]
MERRPYNPNFRENELQPLRKLFEIDSADMASQGYYQNERFAALRQFAVTYIEETVFRFRLLQISKCEPFDAFVPFLAMSYFDRIVSSHNLPKELFRCMEAMETTKFKADYAWSVPIGERTNDSEADKPEPVGTSSPSQRPAKPRSEPIPIPIPGSRAAKPPQPVQASNASLLRAAIPPGTVADEAVGAKAPLKVEMEEIMHPKIDDPYMNFELRWTDPQEPKVTAASVLWALSDGSGLISPTGSTTSVGPGGFSFGNCCPIMKWWTGGAHDQ